MKELIAQVQNADLAFFEKFLYELRSLNQPHLFQHEILAAFDHFGEKEDEKGGKNRHRFLKKFIEKTQEALIGEDHVAFLCRKDIAQWEAYLFTVNRQFQKISLLDFLNAKDRLNPSYKEHDPDSKLRLDFRPFYDYGPSLRATQKIGHGTLFLGNYLAASFLKDPKTWGDHLYKFLREYSLEGHDLLIDREVIPNSDKLIEAVGQAVTYLENVEGTSFPKIKLKLRQWGILDGFGASLERVRSTLALLLGIFDAHDSTALTDFISRIPMISKIAVISPHGWFGQSNVLGRPDTGGQVVYILEQVRGLERAMIEQYKEAGLSVVPKIIVLTRLIPESEGTTSHEKLERIYGTDNAWILRVPFRDRGGNIMPRFIPRFAIWPYLEQFTVDAKSELLAQFGVPPDLIIGNYSDGNLVASLLSERLGVIQCNIAHALEKTKYPRSDLYWQDFESTYHFSLQYTADLISMNMAEFIVTSTAQEITGDGENVGQYESYLFFTMPGLYQVVSGLHLFHPKFNVIPPGVDEAINFPYTLENRRIKAQRERLEQLLFFEKGPGILGQLEEPGRPLVFALSRLDKVKNLPALIEAYGTTPGLSERANLLIIAGTTEVDKAQTEEEVELISTLSHLIEKYALFGKIRWLSNQPKQDTGEIYRIVADREGLFVQPALYEGFGLTIVEAMHCGLPVFATKFGGPSEIIEHGKSGFLIDPTRPDLLGKALLQFFDTASRNKDYWKRISRRGIKRAHALYNWTRYSTLFLSLAKLYEFWRHSTSFEGKRELVRYCDLLYHLFYQKHAETGP